MALADERALAREHYQRGAKLFSLGRFEDAIKEYEAAFELRDDPVLLYDIAQAHRLNGNAQKALFFYKSYLSRAPKAPNADDVAAKITELQRLIDHQRRAQTMPPDSQVSPDKPLSTSPSKPTSPAPSAATTAEPAPAQTTDSSSATAPETTSTTTEAPPAIDARKGRTKKIAGIALIGVGVAAIAAGISMSVIAMQAADDINAASRAGRVFDPAKESLGRTASVVGPVLDGVGAAAAVAGGVVLYLGIRDAKRAAASSHALVVPAIAPGQLGAQLRVTF